MVVGLSYEIFEPLRWDVPLIVSAPHAGIEIPNGFSLPPGKSGEVIEGMSDRNIHQLALPAAGTLGFPVLSSRYLRAFLDLNRSEDELDPLLIDDLPMQYHHIQPNSRVSAGLGIIPRLADYQTPIYANRLSLSAVQSRIKRFYQPYHQKLIQLLDTCQKKFGTCLLIDLHSMPAVQSAAAKRCLRMIQDQPTMKQRRFQGSHLNLVLGDDFGRSLNHSLASEYIRQWQGWGVTIAHNRPYPGGFITAHYGKSVQAFQLEICRLLYPGDKQTTDTKSLERFFLDFVRFAVSRISPQSSNLFNSQAAE